MRRSAVVLPLLLVPFCASAANDYPTLQRVDYVLECMERHGGQDIDNLRSCSCEFDHIASAMSAEDFDNAMAYKEFKDVPADRGGEFRDAKWAKALYEKVLDTRKHAEKQCFIMHVVRKKPADAQK